MPILSFKKRFAPKVRRGEKKQTIRAYRKIPIKPGDHLYLYTALRTKHAEKLADATCVDVIAVLITNSLIITYHHIDKRFDVLDTMDRLDDFAVADGFEDYDDMLQYWLEENGLPFQGDLIKWDDVNEAAA